MVLTHDCLNSEMEDVILEVKNDMFDFSRTHRKSSEYDCIGCYCEAIEDDLKILLKPVVEASEDVGY